MGSSYGFLHSVQLKAALSIHKHWLVFLLNTILKIKIWSYKPGSFYTGLGNTVLILLIISNNCTECRLSTMYRDSVWEQLLKLLKSEFSEQKL